MRALEFLLRFKKQATKLLKHCNVPEIRLVNGLFGVEALATAASIVRDHRSPDKGILAIQI